MPFARPDNFAPELAADVDRVVDLQALYKDDTDLKIAYAYGEIESPRDEGVQASFGSKLIAALAQGLGDDRPADVPRPLASAFLR